MKQTVNKCPSLRATMMLTRPFEDAVQGHVCHVCCGLHLQAWAARWRAAALVSGRSGRTSLLGPSSIIMRATQTRARASKKESSPGSSCRAAAVAQRFGRVRATPAVSREQAGPGPIQGPHRQLRVAGSISSDLTSMTEIHSGLHGSGNIP